MTLNEDQARDAAKQIVGRIAPPAPAVNESSLLYVIFLPTETTPTLSTGVTDFCGYHNSTKFNDASRNNDLFYVIIRTDKINGPPDLSGTGEALVKSLSFCVSHEIAEAVTDRDGRGYHNQVNGNTCEISDLCEPPTKGTFNYRGWDVEHYWSQWDRTCIHGDNPVSISQFLKAIGRTGESLRALGTPIINIEYIASQFR
jgi:hypothetical protein